MLLVYGPGIPSGQYHAPSSGVSQTTLVRGQVMIHLSADAVGSAARANGRLHIKQKTVLSFAQGRGRTLRVRTWSTPGHFSGEVF